MQKKQTLKPAVVRRHRLVYLDSSQNNFTDTLAAPTTSPLPPLEWREINRKLNPLTFTIRFRLKR